MNKSILFLIVIALTFSACNKKLTGFRGSRGLDINTFDFEYLNTKSKVRYADGSTDISATATIRIKRDSIIWMSVSPGLGIELARAIITRDSILVINRLEKDFYAYSFGELSQMFNIELNFPIVQAMLVGNMPFPVINTHDFERDDRKLLLKQRNGLVFVNNTINRETMKLEQLFVSDYSQKNTMTVKYQDFKMLGKEALPFKSLISLLYESGVNTAQTTIEIEHSKADINDSSLKFPFSIPKYANR